MLQRRSASTSTVATANTGKNVDSITQNLLVTNFCLKEYADSINAPTDILGIADIGPPKKKVATEVNFASTFMCLAKGIRAR